MIAQLHADGRLTDIANRAMLDGDVEIDEVAPHPIGARLILDPDNPRRAIPAPVPPPTYAELRAAEYPSTDALVVALWERIVEGRPEASEALQAQRASVKAKYPKPV